MFRTDKAIKAILFVCSFTLITSTIHAQDKPEYRRVGISIQGGVTLGYPDDVNQVFGSNYNVFTRPTYNLGGGVHYAISPFWTAELGYRYNSIEGIEDDGFETTVHSATLKNIFNFNRVFRRNAISEWLNPYLILGFEQDFFTYRMDQTSVSGDESAILGGLGLAIGITDAVSLFSQFEVKFSNNKLDNVNTGMPFDQVGMASGGIRIHFGKKGEKALSLAPPVKFLSDTEYSDFIDRSDRFFSANEEIMSQREKLDELEASFRQNDRYFSAKIEEQQMFTDLLEERVDRLEKRFEDVEIVHELSLKKEVPAGHYVQVFASRSFESAARVKEQFHRLVEDVVENPDEMIFVIKRGSYFEVLIGTFYEFNDAMRTYRIALNRFADSFVITFPRPLHLKDAYEGTEIVWSNSTL